MKKYLLLSVLSFIYFCSNAQGSLNYATYGIGVYGALNYPHNDIKRSNRTAAAGLSLNYYYTPYVPISLDIEVGRLSGGGDTKDLDKDTRRYINDYKSAILHMDVQLGELINYQRSSLLNVLKNFYVGAGFGGIINKVDVNRYSKLDPTYRFPGDDKGLNFVIPLRFGYEFKFYNDYDQPNIRLDIGYQHNITFGEGIDGYNDPSTKFKNNALDQYGQIKIGIKVNLGGQSSYDKEIKGY